MKLSISQLKMIKDCAHEQWLESGRGGTAVDADASLALCWVKAFNKVLGKDNMELYAFPRNLDRSNPTTNIDISGKIEL